MKCVHARDEHSYTECDPAEYLAVSKCLVVSSCSSVEGNSERHPFGRLLACHGSNEICPGGIDARRTRLLVPA